MRACSQPLIQAVKMKRSTGRLTDGRPFPVHELSLSLSKKKRRLELLSRFDGAQQTQGHDGVIQPSIGAIHGSDYCLPGWELICRAKIVRSYPGESRDQLTCHSQLQVGEVFGCGFWSSDDSALICVVNRVVGVDYRYFGGQGCHLNYVVVIMTSSAPLAKKRDHQHLLLLLVFKIQTEEAF